MTAGFRSFDVRELEGVSANFIFYLSASMGTGAMLFQLYNAACPRCILALLRRNSPTTHGRHIPVWSHDPTAPQIKLGRFAIGMQRSGGSYFAGSVS
jgi:hypothetical protein